MSGKYDLGSFLEKRSNRGDAKECLLNFLKNVSYPIRLARFTLANKPTSEYLQTFIRLYVISLVSCLETFYRDLFRYLLDNPQIEFQSRKISRQKLKEMLDAGLDHNDVKAEAPSLQNIESITQTLDPYFSPVGYLASISQGLICKIPSKSNTVARFNFRENWHEDFKNLFLFRHIFVHDANSPSDLTVKKIQNLETLALLLPQLTIWKLDKEIPRLVVSGEDKSSYPVLLLVDDVASDDWEVEENGSSGPNE